MAPSLLDLPNEVLAQAFSYLDTTHLRPCDWDPDSESFTGEEYTNSRPSLYAVALVNHRLHEVARRVLLEDVSIHIGSSGVKYPPMFEYDSVRFTRHCIKYPAVLEHLRKFRVWWYTPSPCEWALDFFNTVSLAPNLTVFQIERFQAYMDPEDRLKILETLIHRLQHLEVFVANIDEDRIPHRSFLAICAMRRLRVFETNCPILAPNPRHEISVDIDDFFEDVPRGHPQNNTRLEKLRCTGEYVDLAVLRHVLSRSPHLKELILSLPGPGLRPYYEELFVSDDTRPKTLGQLFRPDLVSRLLLPCVSSLCELTIANDIMQLSRTNGTTIELAPFSNLRKLTLSNRLISKVVDQGMEELPCLAIELPEKGWYRCLPAGLEFLKIQFDCSRGLLWNLINLRLLENNYNDEWVSGDTGAHARARVGWHSDFEMNLFKPNVGKEIQDASFDQLNWIMDLARNVSSKFRRLSIIKVVENNTVPVDHCGCSWDLIDLVEAYPKAFGCIGLDLELSVRVPNGYVPPPLATIMTKSNDESSQNVAGAVSQAHLLRLLTAQESRHDVRSRLFDAQAMFTTGWGEDE